MHRLIAIFIFLYIASCPALARSQEVIRIYTIEQLDKDAKSVALDKSIAKLLQYLEQNLHAQFEIRRVPWKRAMSNALNEDALLMGMSITQERSTKYAFSDPINANGNWLITRCDATFDYNNLDDLKGKLLGIVLGTSVGDAFDQQANKLFRVENDTGAGIARLQKLQLRRVDALVWYGSIVGPKDMEEYINRTFYADDYEPNNKDRFCVLPRPISIISNHFAMRIKPANIQLLEKINVILAKGRKDGAIAPLNQISR
jgi:ABC-type amino acid transport substrate-binding protein